MALNEAHGGYDFIRALKTTQTLPLGTFYREPIDTPMQAHNASASEAAEILLMQIGHEGEPLMIKAEF